MYWARFVLPSAWCGVAARVLARSIARLPRLEHALVLPAPAQPASPDWKNHQRVSMSQAEFAVMGQEQNAEPAWPASRHKSLRRGAANPDLTLGVLFF